MPRSRDECLRKPQGISRYTVAAIPCNVKPLEVCAGDDSESLALARELDSASLCIQTSRSNGT